jgi:hypothetical protein
VIAPGDVVLVCSAWRRPAYLTRTLDSWKRVRGVGLLGGLVVALGPSDAEEQQRDIIGLASRAMGLDGRVKVLPDSAAAQASPGMHRALGEALAHVQAVMAGDSSRPAKAVICAEEDITVSDDVLEYTLWALNRFEGDPLVATVCTHDTGGQGWHIPGIGQAGMNADQAEAVLAADFNPWVWATWTGRKLRFLLEHWDWDATTGPVAWQHGYDWQILRLIQQRGLLSVVPSASRSQNIGQDGGYYARPELFDQTLSASFRKHRDPVAYRLIGEDHGG